MLTSQASFADIFCQAHVWLLEDLAELEEVLRLKLAESPSDTARRLRALKRKLAGHFTWEEQGGYMASVLERAPHFTHRVGKLLGEHSQLAAILDALITVAEDEASQSGLDYPFWEKVKGWISHVRQHESEEDRLVQEAYNRDFTEED